MLRTDNEQPVIIEPFSYNDPETGDYIEVSGSPEYTKLTINQRTYYFYPATGEFDGASTKIGREGPVLITGGE